MEAVHEMYEDLGASGNVLGGLSPTFHTSSTASHSAADIDITAELAKLGAVIAKFNPREVNIWG
jgi:hypothetical protein